MVKKLLMGAVITSLTLGSVIIPQDIKGSNIGEIPVELVKYGEEDTGGVEQGTYQIPLHNKETIESTDIKKGNFSQYENKAYVKTELGGKPLKSLEWLNQEQGFVKYGLYGESTPNNVELYYKMGEMIPKASYQNQGEKATILFHNKSKQSLEIVSSSGHMISSTEVVINEGEQRSNYSFFVYTKANEKDTSIQVLCDQVLLRPVENLSTSTTKVLKYEMVVEKNMVYNIEVNGTPITESAELAFDMQEHDRKIQDWYSKSYVVAQWKHKKWEIDKPDVIYEAGTEDKTKATLIVNGYMEDEFNHIVAGWLIGKMSIAGERVQIPAPIILDNPDIDYLENIEMLMKDPVKNPTVYTTFSTGRLAGSTVGIRLISKQGAGSGISIGYEITMTNAPKETLPIEVELCAMTQGHISSARTKGITDVQIECWNGLIYSDAPNNLDQIDGLKWAVWNQNDFVLAKSILGNIKDKWNLYEYHRRDMEYPATSNMASTSDQKFNLRFRILDGYINPKVFYSHQEIDINRIPVLTNKEQKLYTREDKVQGGTYQEVLDLVVPRYGFLPLSSNSGIAIGGLSSILFQAELQEVPVYIEGNIKELLANLNVESRTSVQIPSVAPTKEDSYFAGYLLKKYKNNVEVVGVGSDTYYYSGQIISLSDIGATSENGEVLVDEIRLIPQFGVDIDRNDYVKIQTLLQTNDNSQTLIDQKFVAVVSGSYIRLKDVSDVLTANNLNFYLDEKQSDFKKVITKTRVGETEQANAYDCKFDGVNKILNLVYKETKEQSGISGKLTVSPASITLSGSSVVVLELKDENQQGVIGKQPIFFINDQVFTGIVQEIGDGKYEFTYIPDSLGVKTVKAYIDNQLIAEGSLSVVSEENGETNISGGGNTVIPSPNPDQTIPPSVIPMIPDQTTPPLTPSTPDIPSTVVDSNEKDKTDNVKPSTPIKNETTKPNKPSQGNGITKPSNEQQIVTKPNRNQSNGMIKDFDSFGDYTSWYHQALGLGNNVVITQNGLDTLNKLPNGTIIEPIREVRYYLFGPQRGLVRVTLPDGTVKDVEVEVQVRNKKGQNGKVIAKENNSKGGTINGMKVTKTPQTGDCFIVFFAWTSLFASIVIIFYIKERKWRLFLKK